MKSFRKPHIDFNQFDPGSLSLYDNVRRQSAKNTGTLSGWYPEKIHGQMAYWDRRFIDDRVSDLYANNPIAKGIAKDFALNIIGKGLQLYPNFTRDEFPEFSEDQLEEYRLQIRRVYLKWTLNSDIEEKRTFFEQLFILIQTAIRHGEILIRIYDKPASYRPYKLGIKILNPNRLSTPNELSMQSKIYDGIELDNWGAEKAYWIQTKGDFSNRRIDDFTRISRRTGSRINIIHWMLPDECEQLRGESPFATMLKTIKDHWQRLDTEIVSSVAAAAIAYFIKTGSVEASTYADMMRDRAAIEQPGQERIESVDPGDVFYLNKDEDAILADPQRPGTTFTSFMEFIESEIAMGFGMPRAVLFKDLRGMTYAGFRSAVELAWKNYLTMRSQLIYSVCHPLQGLLMEEAIDIGDITIPMAHFQKNRELWTKADWVGPGKDRIDVKKETEAEVIAIGAGLKDSEQVRIENGWTRKVAEKPEVEKVELSENDR